MPNPDVIIVGSGLAALHAAYPIVEAGLNVVMLDVGNDDSALLENDKESFENTRRYQPLQEDIFLGSDLSGLRPLVDSSGHAEAMTSGRRGYITKDTDTLLPYRSGNAVVTQSLAKGGLSAAWGASCSFFDEEECRVVGLPSEEMPQNYQIIVERIGVSGPAGNYILQPPARIDDSSTALMQAYTKKKRILTRRGFTLEQPPLALLTEDKNGRNKTAYLDMDFWSNAGRSVYRGQYTLEKLLAHNNFLYIDHTIVTHIEEKDGSTTVHARDIISKRPIRMKARAVIVAAGALNTTRIMLRSFGLFNIKVPILMKNNFLLPCLSLWRLGNPGSPLRHSLCQLTLRDEYRKNGLGDSYTQLYSYNSLLLHKLLKYVPLPAPEALSMLSLFVPAMTLADVRFSSVLNPINTAMLCKQDTGEAYLDIHYAGTDDDILHQKNRLPKIKSALWNLGLLPLRVIENAYGATSHYAGGTPFSNIPGEFPLQTNTAGQVSNTRTIFIADSATWRALPAKSPALTIMANANRIGTHVRNFLKTTQ